MKGHTPGPWNVSKLIPEGTDDNDYPGAEISWQEVEADGHSHPHEGAVQVYSLRAEADANLIAASPDLLEALRPLAAAASDDPGTSDLSNDQPVTLTLEDVRRAWAAIRKAEGR